MWCFVVCSGVVETGFNFDTNVESHVLSGLHENTSTNFRNRAGLGPQRRGGPEVHLGVVAASFLYQLIPGYVFLLSTASAVSLTKVQPWATPRECEKPITGESSNSKTAYIGEKLALCLSGPTRCGHVH